MRPPKLDVKVTPSLSEAELLTLIDACAGRNVSRRARRRDRLMLETGVRAGEVVDMTVDDVDATRDMVTIRRDKAGRGRVVPFSAQTGRALDRYRRARQQHRLAHTAVFWLGDRGKGFNYDGLYNALQARAQQARIDHSHPHLMRTLPLVAGSPAVAVRAARCLSPAGSVATCSTGTPGRQRPSVPPREARRLNLGDI